MKIRKLASVPLRTDDRDAPLVVGTPRSEQVAKKTENAAKCKKLEQVAKRTENAAKERICKCFGGNKHKFK